jgi:ankyrin repeat/BTB/POZ domain-containing protein 2
MSRRREEDMETAEKLKVELAFRMLSSGRVELLPHALQLLPTTKVSISCCEPYICNSHIEP